MARALCVPTSMASRVMPAPPFAGFRGTVSCVHLVPFTPQLQIAFTLGIPDALAPAERFPAQRVDAGQQFGAAFRQQQAETRAPQQQIVEMHDALMPGRPAQFAEAIWRLRNR